VCELVVWLWGVGSQGRRWSMGNADEDQMNLFGYGYGG
jgi:hypothetical protein